MSERVDHAAEAVRIMGEDGWTTGIAAAHVHATLALVEQQRIANLIAYVHVLEIQFAEGVKNPSEFDWQTRADSQARHGLALADIREGLGL